MQKTIVLVFGLLYGLASLAQGSCASPDGTQKEIASPPASYQQLEDNNYCMDGTGSTAVHTMCFTFTNAYGDIAINMGFSHNCNNVAFYSFELFDNTCSSVGTGLTYSGLDVGDTYTFCISMRAFGGGGCGGFDRVCPYWMNNTPLPVTLDTVYCDNHVVYWETLEEVNNSHFEIFKTHDMKSDQWEYLGMVMGKGMGSSYIFKDPSIDNGITYYKVEQIDYDGKRTDLPITACALDYEGDDYVVTEVYDMFGRRLAKPERLVIEKRLTVNGIEYKRVYRPNL